MLAIYIYATAGVKRGRSSSVSGFGFPVGRASSRAAVRLMVES